MDICIKPCWKERSFRAVVCFRSCPADLRLCFRARYRYVEVDSKRLFGNFIVGVSHPLRSAHPGVHWLVDNRSLTLAVKYAELFHRSS